MTHITVLVRYSYCGFCVSQAAQQDNAPEEVKKEDNDKGEEEQREEEGNEGKRSKRSVYDDMQEVTEPARLQERDMQSYNKKQPGGEEKGTDKLNGRPAAQRPGNSDVRLQDPGNQGDNAQATQEQYEHRDPDNQQRETIHKEDEEDHDEQESELSRKNINKQMAEMQQNYDEKRTKEQRQKQEMEILPQDRNSDARGRSVYRHVAPIPAVQRQDAADEQADGRLFCQEVPSSLCTSFFSSFVNNPSFYLVVEENTKIANIKNVTSYKKTKLTKDNHFSQSTIYV